MTSIASFAWARNQKHREIRKKFKDTVKLKWPSPISLTLVIKWEKIKKKMVRGNEIREF